MEEVNAFDKFFLLSNLKPNKAKCGIIGIGVLKGVWMALLWYGLYWLNQKAKILGIYLSCNKKLEIKKKLYQTCLENRKKY